MPKGWRFYEGTSSANTIIKDIAKVLCQAVKDDPILDDLGNVIKVAEIIQEKNWDIVFPAVNTNEVIVDDWNDLSPEEFKNKIENQLSQIYDTVVLKTTTTPVVIQELNDDLGLEQDLEVDSIDMYLELYKPKYMADPEIYGPETERLGIIPYNITKEIYTEYAASTEKVTIDLMNDNDLNGASIRGMLKQVPFDLEVKNQSEVITVENYEDTTPIATTIRTIYQLVAAKNGYSPSYPNSVNSTITTALLNVNELFADPITGELNDEGLSLSTLWNSKSVPGYDNDLLSWDTIKFVFSKVTTPSPAKYKMTISLKKTVIKYQIPSTFSLTIDGNNIDDVKFVINNVTQKGSYEVNSNIFTIKDTGNPPSKKNIPLEIKAITDGYFSTDPILITYIRDREETNIAGKKLIYNNHYIYTRIFDVPNDSLSGPKANDVDLLTGEILSLNSHVSEWAKLSWYQDFEEVMLDIFDNDPGEADLSEGVVFLPIETPGLIGDTRLKFWINTNNDRSIISLMGNPSIDFSKNRHILTNMYVGKLESFDNSINDTSGNFALYVGSSTIPCSTKTVTSHVIVSVAFDDEEAYIGFGNGQAMSFTKTLTAGKSYFEGTVGLRFGDDQIVSPELYHVNASTGDIVINITFEENVFPQNNEKVYLSFSYYKEVVSNVHGVIRDSFGNNLEIKYPDTYGVNTSTGVTDVAMLHTRSRAYFQKHYMMFTTTEEYMTKVMYGKSAYTGEYYADKIKITHGNDGPRGILQGMLVIDQSSLVALDELIVNRDFTKDATKPEEKYIFFPINATFSPFSGSPNATYGVAVKKTETLPAPVDDTEAVKRVLDDLYIGKTTNIRENLILPTEIDGVTITWESDDETAITIEDTL